MPSKSKIVLPVSGPPAVWSAFVRQGQWKTWVLLAQFATICCLLALCFVALQKPPDIIVVSEDGASTYVEASASSAGLRSWLNEQRGKASDITLRAFTERFVKLTVGINSTTIDESWAEATSLMVAPLAQRINEEMGAQRLMETYRLASLRTTLDFRSIDVMERRADKTHVRVQVGRHKEKLAGGGASDDLLQVELVLLDVPRTRRNPDGLQVLDWRSAAVDPTPSSSNTTAVTP